MNDKELAVCMALLNAGWEGKNKPFSKTTAQMWGAELRPYPYPEVERVIRHMVRTQEWRPSLAQVFRALTGGGEKTASAAFENVWRQIGKRPRRVTDLEARAVLMLGGWHQLGMWKEKDRHWHGQRFADVYNELLRKRQGDRLQSIASGEIEARDSLALAGGTRGSQGGHT